MEKGILEKTGKPLSYWTELVKAAGLDKHKAIIDFLKQEHGFTHGYANFISLKARSADAASHDPKELLEKQYQGKECLKAIYDLLISQVKELGDDITITPKKDSVSLIRKKQFALAKPATKTRIDLGLKLKDKPLTNRLENSGPFGSMCTHRVKLSHTNDVDSELMNWLKEAYERAG